MTVNSPQIPSALDTYGKMLQLKSLMGQQQLIPYQVQEAQQKVQSEQMQNEAQKIALQSQQAMMRAWSNPDFLKNVTTTDPAKANGLGFDPDAMTKALVAEGVMPKDALAMSSQFIERSQKMAETAKAQAQTGEALATQRQKGYQVLADQIGAVLDAPSAKAGNLLTQLKQDVARNPDKYSGVPQQDLAHVYAADLEHLPAIASVIGLDAKIADFHKSKAEATKAEQGVIPEGGGLSPESKQQVAKDVTVAKLTQPLKIEQSAAEGKARQLIQGLGESVYAFLPDGSRQLMSKTDALQSGVRTMTPVTEKEVSEDIQLNNRLGDVQQKLARYEDALKKLGTTVTEKDQGNIAALMGKGALKVGAFGTEISMERVNAALDKENIHGLSEDAKKLLVSFYNARESMQGYQRVLSGSARGNEKGMELNLDALPSPAISDASYAAESLKQFRENLDIIGQGLPRIPGIKTPKEIEAGIRAHDPLGIR